MLMASLSTLGTHWAAMVMTRAVASSAEKPREGLSFDILTPMALMSRIKTTQVEKGGRPVGFTTRVMQQQPPTITASHD